MEKHNEDCLCPACIEAMMNELCPVCEEPMDIETITCVCHGTACMKHPRMMASVGICLGWYRIRKDLKTSE